MDNLNSNRAWLTIHWVLVVLAVYNIALQNRPGLNCVIVIVNLVCIVIRCALERGRPLK